MSPGEPPTGLRERKKRQTRAAILAVAERLFGSRGYEHVTVAEIADAANISVKTLFTYFRSKEDLAFADESRLRDQLVAAVASRPGGTTAVQAVVRLLDQLIEQDDGQAGGEAGGLEGYHRMVSGSDALQSRLRRMWEGYEDALTAVLAGAAGGASAAPSARLTAMALVAMVRSTTSPEVLAEVARHRTPAARAAALRRWVATAAAMLSGLEQDLR